MASKELLEMLNKGIARELQVVVQYMWQHVLWSGIQAYAVKDELKDIAVAEMKHAEAFAERLAYLGGIPTTKPDPIFIFVLGLVAFAFSTAGGLLLAKGMNLFLKEKINPLIGAAGVSAVPMAARVAQVEGQKANPKNFLLMHAMGPNLAGVIGTITAAGLFITMLR